MSRRSKPAHLCSDNGTNPKYIISLKNISLIPLTTYQKNQLHGISCPSLRRFEKSDIKIIIFHMSRVIGQTLLSFEELRTLLVQVESLINSRSWTTLNSDPNKLEPLAPAHFYFGKSMTTLPNPYINGRNNRLPRFYLFQQMMQHKL